MSSYTTTITLDVSPQDAEVRVREALAAEGFGILTEIDVQATLRAKIGVEMPHYRILGACNPPLAHRAIQADGDIGALLPCNVVIRAREGGGTEVVAVDPAAMLDLSATPELTPIATEAAAAIGRALAAVDAG